MQKKQKLLKRFNMKNIWFDFTNAPHINTLLPIINYLESKGHNSLFSARDFSETIKLLKQNNIDFLLAGKHGGKLRLLKSFSLFFRSFELLKRLPTFDLSISMGFDAPIVSKIRKKKSIVIEDNDITQTWIYGMFVDYVFCPRVLLKTKLTGINNKKIIPFSGFKEDIYLSNYKPDNFFLNKLPFDNFITVRPENIYASYMKGNIKSIVPELIDKLLALGFNILYLPRYKIDHSYFSPNNNIYVPPHPLNGLDICYYSTAVLTGAGTFAREAALLGTPAVSFYGGNKLLQVDKEMIEKSLMIHSRDIDTIINYVLKSTRGTFNQNRSVEVFNYIMYMIEKIKNYSLY